MGNDLPGKIIGALIAFALCIIAPFVTISNQNEMLDRRMIINHVTDFLDEVIDSRTVTDAALAELNINLASYGIIVDYEITRYALSIDPDPVTGNAYTTSYIVTDDNRHYNKGDKLSIRVYTVGYSSTQALAHKLTGMFVKDLDETITVRIR